jgi:putative transposase
MRKLDERHLDHPMHGGIADAGFSLRTGACGQCQTLRRLLRLMGIMAHYSKRNLSKLGQARYVRPYLLRGLEITHANQVWAIDITYYNNKHVRRIPDLKKNQ